MFLSQNNRGGIKGCYSYLDVTITFSPALWLLMGFFSSMPRRKLFPLLWRDEKRLRMAGKICLSFLWLRYKSARSAFGQRSLGQVCEIWGFTDSFPAALEGLQRLWVQSRVRSLHSSCISTQILEIFPCFCAASAPACSHCLALWRCPPGLSAERRPSRQLSGHPFAGFSDYLFSPIVLIASVFWSCPNLMVIDCCSGAVLSAERLATRF